MVVKHCLVRWWTRRDQSARSIGRILRRARRTDGRTDGSKKGGKNEIESGLSGAYDLQCANGPRGASFWTLTPGQVPVPPRTIANSRCSLQAFRGIVLAFLVRLSARKVSSGFELSVSRSSQVRVQIIFLASFVFPPLPASFSSSSSLRSDNRRGDVRYIISRKEQRKVWITSSFFLFAASFFEGERMSLPFLSDRSLICITCIWIGSG